MKAAAALMFHSPWLALRLRSARRCPTAARKHHPRRWRLPEPDGEAGMRVLFTLRDGAD